MSRRLILFCSVANDVDSSCAALPLVNSAGTSITCTTQSDLDARIAATGATTSAADSASGSSTSVAAASTSSVVASASTTRPGASDTSTTTTSAASATASGDLQSSLCLDPSLVQTGFEQDGQQVPTAGQVASLTSKNNFINFCATVPSLPPTNGQQVKGGSCNA